MTLASVVTQNKEMADVVIALVFGRLMNEYAGEKPNMKCHALRDKAEEVVNLLLNELDGKEFEVKE